MWSRDNKPSAGCPGKVTFQRDPEGEIHVCIFGESTVCREESCTEDLGLLKWLEPVKEGVSWGNKGGRSMFRLL